MSLRKAVSSVFRSSRTQNLGLRGTPSHRLAPLCGAAGSIEHDRSKEYIREALVALSLLAGIASAGSLLTTTSKCDEAEEEPYDVYSSSDPMDLPSQSDEGTPLEEIHLTDIKASKIEELNDAASDFSKSMRAFGSCLESTAAIRRRQTPLATSKDEMTAEDRMYTLGPHETETVTTRNVYFYKASQIHDGIAEKFVLIAGPSSEDLGADIGHLLGVRVSRAEVGKFADGYVKLFYPCNITEVLMSHGIP